MRDRSDVLDAGYFNTRSVDGPDSCLTAGTRSFNENLCHTHTSFVSYAGSIGCSYLSSIRGILLGSAEASLTSRSDWIRKAQDVNLESLVSSLDDLRQLAQTGVSPFTLANGVVELLMREVREGGSIQTATAGRVRLPFARPAGAGCPGHPSARAIRRRSTRSSHAEPTPRPPPTCGA